MPGVRVQGVKERGGEVKREKRKEKRGILYLIFLIIFYLELT
jgi:hypothetical protein